ncbi:2EXR domain-containing protein [Fusarium acuminatum]|uniref:2EXR domain-containing protein n=1 Tax=Fusarium acuminatum TaxID=5515 RepID=A0ABZ2WXJ7_9HYPO
MTTFRRFTELPREIRDRIWTLAIRDDRPGVHIFGQYKTGSHRIESWGGTSFDLVAPSWSRYFESLDEHRSDENISTYLIDGGLWTACHESRSIMEKHFKQSERQSNLRPHNKYGVTSSEKELFKRATSGYFDCAPLEIVTVFPHRDLFILQHDDLEKVDWLCLGHEASMASTREGFSGVGHIAIEYDRSWGDGIDIDYELLHGCVGAQYTLWFIDRSLKRKSQAPVYKEELDCSWKLNSFYASDRKFLEITDTDKLFDDWEYIGPVETYWYEHISDSRSFVRQLESDLTDRYIAGGLEAEKPCTVGLLGWAPL